MLKRRWLERLGLHPTKRQLRAQIALLWESVKALEGEKEALNSTKFLQEELCRLRNGNDILNFEHIPALVKEIERLRHENDTLNFEVVPALRQESQRHWEGRMELLQRPHETADIVMLGDSLTDWGKWRELLPGLNLLNRGVAGETSTHILARLNEVVMRKPKIVFLMIGTNDITHGAAPAAILQNISAIIQILRNESISTVTQSIVYRALPPDDGLNDAISDVNSRVLTFCRDEGIPFVDLNTSLAPKKTLLPEMHTDGLHFTPAAYQVWREIVLRTIAELAPELLKDRAALPKS